MMLKKEFPILTLIAIKKNFELHDSMYKILNGDFMVKIGKIII